MRQWKFPTDLAFCSLIVWPASGSELGPCCCDARGHGKSYLADEAGFLCWRPCCFLKFYTLTWTIARLIWCTTNITALHGYSLFETIDDAQTDPLSIRQRVRTLWHSSISRSASKQIEGWVRGGAAINWDWLHDWLSECLAEAILITTTQLLINVGHPGTENFVSVSQRLTEYE